MPPRATPLTLLLVLALLPLTGSGHRAAPVTAPPGPPSQSSREARRDFTLAYRNYQAGKLDEAIALLEKFIEAHSADPLKERAEQLLREAGQGEDIRVRLLERKTFHKAFELREAKVLELSEKAIDQVRAAYAKIEPVFEKATLEVLFYDSAPRYKKATGFITASGNYKTTARDFEKKEMAGVIHWYIPRRGSSKDRELRMQSVLVHEGGHFLNHQYFGGFLPSLFEEGIAVFHETRLVTEPGVTRRETVRQRYEGEARNGLGHISRFKGFEELVGSSRGFGKGDAMITRWYAFCYAVIDCLVAEEGWETPASTGEVFAFLSKQARDRAEGLEKEKAGETVSRLDPAKLLEELVKELHDTDLKTFHRKLVAHIQTKYKQR